MVLASKNREFFAPPLLRPDTKSNLFKSDKLQIDRLQDIAFKFFVKASKDNNLMLGYDGH